MHFLVRDISLLLFARHLKVSLVISFFFKIKKKSAAFFLPMCFYPRPSSRLSVLPPLSLSTFAGTIWSPPYDEEEEEEDDDYTTIFLMPSLILLRTPSTGSDGDARPKKSQTRSRPSPFI